MASQSKIAKLANNQTTKLWNHEPRMFAEKFFYLNKSTTKYGIVGIDAELFVPVLRICDRATGSYITIKRDNFDAFTQLVASVVDGTYSLERSFIKNSGADSGIKFYSQGNDIWKLCQTNGNHNSVLMHKNSFKTFIRGAKIIRLRITNLDPVPFLKYIDVLRENTIGLEETAILDYLNGLIDTLPPRGLEYQVIFDLIFNRDSYFELERFSSGFYNRNTDA